ncbi:glycosyltransferase [Synechococcus sp. CCY9202]|uniref:glycosyltransferase n=1 Tax=Synechococcus sp. CCY9202 TaxID=174698 RepID=UPI002B20F78E|nr:glycosyltransferase [Synechococcus sp. CCY9202]MEA5422251.1 glycosyltransferase [Synechococcus sp. CCY9202]
MPSRFSQSVSIGFDGQIFRRQRRGGISRYFRELALNLRAAGAEVLMAEERQGCWPWSGHLPWRRADVVHATFYGGGPYRLQSHQRLVSSLFDMTPERHPEHFFLPALRSPHANKPGWLEVSDLIISISAASADDLAFFQPTLRTPLRVIHLATAIDRLVPQPVEALEGRRFWLMVGKRHAYKNGLTLLRALSLLHGGDGDRGRRDQPLLVCAGGGPWRAEERRWIHGQGLEDAVLQLAATDPVLAWLYRHAEAVLVPSLAEGFSLPLIEALACDTPVVASDLEVHREVGQSFATLLPALNARVWSELLAAAGQETLPRPSHRLGGERYARLRRHFSPERLVQDHLEAYGSTTDCPSPRIRGRRG